MGLLRRYFIDCFFGDQKNWILWLPVLFGCGIVIYFSNSSNTIYLPAFLLLLFTIIASWVIGKKPQSLALITIASLLAGFLWAKFYTEKIINTPQINNKLYATAIGKINQINNYPNSNNKNKISQTIVLRDVAFYKVGVLPQDKFLKKEKLKKPKKKKATKTSKKPRKKRQKKITNPKQNQQENKEEGAFALNPEQQVKELKNQGDKKVEKIKAKKKRKVKNKKSKQHQKTVIRNYLNYPGLQEIDREFLAKKNQFETDSNWYNNKYLNPPKKIIIRVNNKIDTQNNQAPQIGDLVMVRVFLEPIKKPDLLSSYNFARDLYFKGVGGSGFAVSDIKTLKPATKKFLGSVDELKILRQKIAQKILNGIPNQEISGVAIALSNGDQNYIPAKLIADIRNSGLAHLLSISGLHLAIASGIFFFSIRFLLSCNQFLTLNFDIKKISAIIALIAGFFYLLIVDMPIPAVRSFLMLGLIFIAILIDRTHNPLRSIAFAALIILIFNPYAILLVSFQLSFAAILALITLYNYNKNLGFRLSSKPFYLQPIFYVLGTALASFAAEIAITPFSIYHFNNYIQYGVLANMIAIPLTSFIVMPAIFLSMALMPFGLEQLIFPIITWGIELLIAIGKFVSALPFANIPVKMISTSSFAIIILSGLWFLLWQKSWRYLAILGIGIGIFLAYQTPIPKLLIDSEGKYFAFYTKEHGLIFSKNIRSDRQKNNWMKKMAEGDFKTINQLDFKQKQENFCQQDFCQLKLNNKAVLILIGRNKTEFICTSKWQVLINMTKKYQLPECILKNQHLNTNKIVIDNYDLLKTPSQIQLSREF